MTVGDRSAPAAVDDTRARGTKSVLAYCARCERYAAVADVRVDGVVGEGPAHVCEDCRNEGDGAAEADRREPSPPGERAEGSDRGAPIVPHTGQTTDLIAAGPER